ncbi:MAG: phosphoribosylformylglycinamidine synthase [Candidatus Magnetomorum sp.]|nr:phosphoribosylformylglycinamidine synthase [Candidatus Magnetomorum sp.]
MPSRFEITYKPSITDAEGNVLIDKARRYFNIDVKSARTIRIVTIDAHLSAEQIQKIQTEIFTHPVTQLSDTRPLSVEFDWCIWVGFRPGVRDNQGSTAMEAIQDLLDMSFKKGMSVYTSKRYCLCGSNLTRQNVEIIAQELLANDIVQQWRIFSKEEWDPHMGIGYIIPRVELNHTPTVITLTVESDERLKILSKERNLALQDSDIPVIRYYFLQPEVLAARASVNLSDPTDIELEYISQARSDHCNHNTFRGQFHYTDIETGKTDIIDNLFKTYIEAPTLAIQSEKDWVVSVLWDNAGVGRFDQDHYYVITGETHNSPSNMEAYGGSLTGIVGVYRDPLGTGKGAKLIMGAYGFCVGHRDYKGPFKPKLHPRRLLDGVIEGVRDGGNKSGVPTPFGQVIFDSGYMGKCLVFVTALGMMPATIGDKPSENKATQNGDLIIMCGGRVGKDGIHGVTASSEIFSEHTPAGHVQIGDPYTQKKMHDFLLDVRDENLITFITDNGGGGLSSSIGESARFSNGCVVHLDKVPLKYEGLDQWEIWISESQERMTVAIRPENHARFMALADKHAVECSVIGEYTNTGKLHILFKGQTCAYVDMDLLTSGFPKWSFDAQWRSPSMRGLCEPVIQSSEDLSQLVLDILERPNICSKEWIARQYDHEVQGTSIIKPLVGEDRDVPGDASVICPVLGNDKGLAFAQAIIPMYSKIDAWHMTACTIDEAVRRLIATGARPDHIGGVDNYCWPNIQYHETENPDGMFKAAQLVRSCQALKKICMAYGIPLLSGKDSMYVDGHLPGAYGERHKISALETLQFSAVGFVDDVCRCMTLDFKQAGDYIYVLGETRNELGASEYYEHLGYTGCNVPEVDTEKTLPLYLAIAKCIQLGLLSSVHGVYRGGLAIHLAMCAMAGNLGLAIDSQKIPSTDHLSDDKLLFSESAGRFIVSVPSKNKDIFETSFQEFPCNCIGEVLKKDIFQIKGLSGQRVVDLLVSEMKTVWKRPYKDLI